MSCATYPLLTQSRRQGRLSSTRSNKPDDARVFAATVNSYRKHCGQRAIEAAEADLLGQALDMVEKLAFMLKAHKIDCVERDEAAAVLKLAGRSGK